MTEEEYEDLKPNRLLVESKLNVVIKPTKVSVIKNRYAMTGEYTNNDFVRLLRNVFKSMRKAI